MRIISNFFYFSLSLLFFILYFAPYSYGIGNVDWVLFKENNEGKEWLDKGSIKPLPNGEISVLTKFFKNPTNSDDDGELSLYVMRINCDEKKFKDTSINGIPQFNSKWQTSNNDELIDIVIEIFKFFFIYKFFSFVEYHIPIIYQLMIIYIECIFVKIIFNKKLF